MFSRQLLTSALLFCGLSALAQVGINTTTPAAQLEIQSSSQAAPTNTDGIIIPKIDAFPATNPTASQQAMMVYLTTASGANSPGFYYWDNTTTSWIPIGSGKSWNLTGNSATSPATHFIGTTDNQPLAIRTNNTEHLRLNANGNLGIATASPQAKLHVFNGASGLTPNLFSPAIIEGNGLTYLNVLSNAETGVVFGSGGSGTNGGIIYNSGIYTNGMNFRTGGNQNRMNISATGQVSIGNALANARLQILASNQAAPANTDGIIIPKIDAFPATNPTAAQQAMMVYLNTASGANLPGFYYWDNATSSWIGIVSSANSDADWFEEGTTKSPNAITDNIFHMGNIAIGKNTTNYPLEIDNPSYDTTTNLNTNYTGVAAAFGIRNLITGTGASQQTGLSSVINNSGNGMHIALQSTLNGSGTGAHYGAFNTLSGTGNGTQTALFSTITNTGTGQHIGVSNLLSGTGVGTQTGISNSINNTGTGAHYGIANTLSGSGNGFRLGISNQLNNSGTGDNTAISNDITKTGNGNVEGMHTLINGSGTGVYSGIGTVITKTGSGNAYGMTSQISGASSGEKYGVFSYIDPTAGGNHSGIYSEVTKPGPNNFAGYFIGNVGIDDGSGTHYKLPPTRGTNDQIMQTDALGNVTWKDPNTALNNYAWGTLGNSGTNAATHFIGTTDNQALSIRTNGTERLNVSNNGNVALGAFTAAYPIEFKTDLGDKLCLYNSGPLNTYGFGIQNSLLQIHSSFAGSDIAFGYGISTAFAENMRIKGNGNVGIGTASAMSKLHTFRGTSGMIPNPAAGITIEDSTNSFLNLLSTFETGVLFGANGNATNGGIVYNSGVYSNGMAFRTNGNVNRMILSSAGNLTVGNAVPNARVDVLASNQAVPANTDGVLIPRVDTFPATNPGAAQNGMMIFLTTSAGANPAGFYYWDNASVSWIGVGNKSNWSLQGNSGTNPASQYIGTTDNVDVSLRANGTEVMRLASGGNVGINTATPTSELEVNGFTKLGSNAPAVKMLKLTGVTGGVQGNSTSLPHGLTSTKILAVNVLVEYTAGASVPPSYNGSVGYEYDYFVTSAAVVIWTKSGNSANILTKPIRVLVTYEE